ncbi:unnamed protein product [Oikopleura dioica]|uniref:Uncharacterized protein n=1 Tax=Oikopleura dioica TaxID=34765 RepID=E4XCH2_OIKDI|nr:unnamed protein product [Oikopleura dioica]
MLPRTFLREPNHQRRQNVSLCCAPSGPSFFYAKLIKCRLREVSATVARLSSYRQKISKFSSYYSGQLAPPGLKYIFPKSYRHQLYSFIRRSCEESFKESEL